MKTSLPATTVATINNQQIIIIENGEKRVAVKPICDALGVAYQGQIDKLKTDEILGSTVMPSMMVGADKKEREMQTIPFKYVFGWLFTINPKNVAPEARESVILYKKECYEALYQHFTLYAEFVDYRQKAIDEKLDELKEVRANFSHAKNKLKEAETAIDDLRSFDIDSYRRLKAQTVMEFPEGETNKEGVDNG